MSFKKQIDDYQAFWAKYCTLIKEGKLEPPREPVFHGRKMYDDNNPPFLAAVFMIPSTVWEPIQLIQADLERTDPRQKFHQPNFFHITLEEYGWEDQIDLGDILRIMKKLLAHYSSFEIQLKGLNCFLRTIYLQVFDKSQNLLKIYKEIHQRFPNLKEDHPEYIPHVTIAEILTDEARSLLTLIEKKYRAKEISRIKLDKIHIVRARPYLTVGRIETIDTISLK